MVDTDNQTTKRRGEEEAGPLQGRSFASEAAAVSPWQNTEAGHAAQSRPRRAKCRNAADTHACPHPSQCGAPPPPLTQQELQKARAGDKHAIQSHGRQGQLIATRTAVAAKRPTGAADARRAPRALAACTSLSLSLTGGGLLVRLNSDSRSGRQLLKKEAREQSTAPVVLAKVQRPRIRGQHACIRAHGACCTNKPAASCSVGTRHQAAPGKARRPSTAQPGRAGDGRRRPRGPWGSTTCRGWLGRMCTNDSVRVSGRLTLPPPPPLPLPPPRTHLAKNRAQQQVASAHSGAELQQLHALAVLVLAHHLPPVAPHGRASGAELGEGET